MAKKQSDLSPEARQLFEKVRDQWGFGEDQASLAVLATFTQCWDRVREARAEIAKSGPFIEDRFGVPKPHPALAVERSARDQMLQSFRALQLDVNSVLREGE